MPRGKLETCRIALLMTQKTQEGEAPTTMETGTPEPGVSELRCQKQFGLCPCVHGPEALDRNTTVI